MSGNIIVCLINVFNDTFYNSFIVDSNSEAYFMVQKLLWGDKRKALGSVSTLSPRAVKVSQRF